MSRASLLLLFAILYGVACAAGSAQEKQTEMDSSGRPRFYETQFGRYGHLRAMGMEKAGVRFQLPAAAKGLPQTGLYSHFALAGNFEVSVSFQLTSLPRPKDGYGLGCGIAVDTDGPDGNLALTRIHHPGDGHGYTISRGRPEDKELKYETKHYPTKGQAGRLVLRREGAEVICLVADSVDGEPRELDRIAFTKATVRKVRLFADAGGSTWALDVGLFGFRARAEEITGGIPERDQGSGLFWWLIAGAVVLAGAGYLVWRRRRAADE